MRLVGKLLGILFLCVLTVSAGSSYYQVQHEKNLLRADLQKRAEVLAESLEQNIEQLRAEGRGLEATVQRFGNREHLLGIAVYRDAELPVAITPSLMARVFTRPWLVVDSLRKNKPEGQFLRLQGVPVHLFSMPLRSGTGALLVVSDASYISDGTSRAWREMSFRVLLQLTLIGATILVMFQRSVMKPIARTAAWMHELRNGRASAPPPAADMMRPLMREAASLAHTLDVARASAQKEAMLRVSAESLWTAERLAVCLDGKLRGSRLFVVANREPYMHTRSGRTVQTIVPASGLVTALEPVLRACDGTWVAHGSGSADREFVDAHDRVRVPPDDPRYTLRRVWLSKEEEQGYYFGLANEGLWPLCHIAHTRPTFRASDWEQYRKVNAKFADALLEEMAETPQPVVIVQDYHFALLPKMIKQRRPEARVGIFWHIPWPNPEAFGICPWQREILEGLLGADLLGFHVQYHCDHFLETVDRALESRIEWERFAVNRGDHVTLVRPFPISVVFPEPEQAPAKPFHAHQAEVLQEIGCEALYIGVGVDRVDYTKGILERFRGVERFLDKYPQYRGKFSFVQIGAPSRTNIPQYHDFIQQVEAEAARVNARFENAKWKPIWLRHRHHSHAEVERFYRASDVCLVTSLHDGMNLVAKEYVAARHDEDGVLILSPFTGAARELPDALIVNPYDTEALADAIFHALEMDAEHRRARMRRMRAQVKQQNVYRWAGNLISELCDVRVDITRRKLARAAAAGAPDAVADEFVYQVEGQGSMSAAGEQLAIKRLACSHGPSASTPAKPFEA